MSTMTWNPQSHSDYDLLKGYDVYTSDDEKVGTIKDVLHPPTEMPTARGRHYFKVEPGMLKQLFSDQDEFYLPERLIQTVQPQEDKVILEMPKSRLKNADWMQPRDVNSFRRS
jgi:sporulation protein YlmC with PRC-barrel domain